MTGNGIITTWWQTLVISGTILAACGFLYLHVPTKADIIRIESQMATKADIESLRVELTHSGVVSAEEAVMMLGYDPKQLIEHPVKHRNAERSDWFAVIGPYFHIIEIQWFDAKKLDRPGKFGSVTQIRVSVW